MKRTYRYDVEADMIYEVGSNYFEERPQGPSIIRDDLPGGIHGMLNHADRKVYDSKSRYLAEVRARGCEVVGNDSFSSVTKPDFHPKGEIGRDIKRAIEEHRQFGSDAVKRAEMINGRR